MPFRPGVQYYNYNFVNASGNSDASDGDLSSEINKLLIEKLIDDERDTKQFQNFVPGGVDENDDGNDNEKEIKVVCSVM